MFSTQPRCLYQHNPLGEVICQLRFPEILTIETNLPADFQESIRDAFPVYSCHKENNPPKLVGAGSAIHLEPQPQTNNYQFLSADGAWKVNLTKSFISLSCSRYTCWEDFALQLDKPLAAFIQHYRPAYFDRIGLRYLNFISRKSLKIEHIPFRKLIESPYLGLLADEEIQETACSKNIFETELAIRGGCRAKIHAGPGVIKRNGQEDKEVRFIFDQDLFMTGKLAINLSAVILETLHAQADSIFRGAITDTLHNAMEPEIL